MTAARLAAAGCTADHQRRSGFWALYGPAERDEFAVDDGWAIVEDGIDVKAYPCCYFTHAAIAATQDLDTDIALEDAHHIVVEASAGAADDLPHEDPETGLEAKFSMKHAIACAATRDRVGIDAFEADALADPAIGQVREHVDLRIDKNRPYDDHGTTVTVETGTETLRRVRTDPPGTHDDPLSEAELRAKFDECARRGLPAADVDELHNALSDLPTVEDAVAALAGIRRSS